ncbi:MAG TPA: glycosyltransferase family 1 protein [Chromatiaceae bacterium]|jgi:glycosyltransferase involved in cell wall biosynthesis|nr:glycosyltransferase family 1 protein [Chromatiaceae bacterium]HIB83580.1 glycosyltransferase family 1 protein [Chromatiaceae bacterium]HIO02584.1 glycosyltransferase family 1 protein [Alphaproteobacteria bacterium]
MKESVKVLYVSSRGDIGGGGENYLLTLFNNIDKNRFKPIVVLPNDGSLRQPLEALGVEVLVIEANYGWLQPDAAWYKTIEGAQSRVNEYISLIQNHKIDLIHTNSNLRFEGAMAAQITGTPHLYLAHIEYQPEMPIFQRVPLHLPSFAQLMDMLSDHTAAVSWSVANTLASHISNGAIEVIHNGLELRQFDDALAVEPNAFRTELGLTADDILITAAGRISPDKGFDYFVEAAKRVSELKPDHIHFAIAGDPENTVHATLLNELVQKHDLSDRFHFLGFRKDIGSILAGSDIFVLSSRKEGHPYIMLEAMASKCAVVACNCAGVEETIEDGVSGFIVPLGDTDLLAERIDGLIDSRELRDRMADAARTRIESSFTADRTANKLMECYDRLVSLTAKPPGSIGIELFLQNCAELGRLGNRSIELEHRLSQLERNPFSRLCQFAKQLFGNKPS